MRTFNEFKKNLKKDFTGFKKIKIAILANTASQFLTQALKGIGFEDNIDYEIFEADYNQIDNQVLDNESDLYKYNPNYVLIIRSSEKLLKSFYKLSPTQKESFANDEVEYLKNLYNNIQNNLKAKVITNNYAEINDSVFGNYASKVVSSFLYQIRKTNFLLMNATQELNNLFLLDYSAIINQNGYSTAFDNKMYINADMNLSIDILPTVAISINDIIKSIEGQFKKCIILDLDNTTWGGIIGDDGIEGIQIGDLGVGKAFTALQLWVKELIKRGIILAICSKNTESIAKEPFEKHPDMVLKLDDIAVFVANWETKVDNIRHIQSILNIGFDSMVFLDDNPFEREMVKQAIPQITVPNLPEDPTEYLTYIRSLNLFETASFTQNDNERTKQYQVEAKRVMLQKSFTNEKDFLKSLDMKSEVKSFDKFTIPRVAQLSQRSNQFNLRTVRYTDEDIAQIAANPSYKTVSFTLTDAYGDNGLISMIILKLENNAAFIDTWIMSCRVLKRTMENFVLNTIVDIAKQNNIKTIVGEYLPTAKNAMVKDHYINLGFTTNQNLFELEVESFEEKETFISTSN